MQKGQPRAAAVMAGYPHANVGGGGGGGAGAGGGGGGGGGGDAGGGGAGAGARGWAAVRAALESGRLLRLPYDANNYSIVTSTFK
jgi:hypothetical protein